MKFHKKFRVRRGHPVRLKDEDPSFTGGISKKKAATLMAKNEERLYKEQYRLFAENKRALLIVLQGIDTSGKDGVIRHVMRGLNPQGCRVTSFKAPTAEERKHDFLWRIRRALPSKGDIGIFNRSHYEDVLIARVNRLVPDPVWKGRYEKIRRFERELAKSGVAILKFFLHISNKEQKKRLEERLKDPEKIWKFNPNGLIERQRWDDYMKAYEDALNACSTKEAPWFVIPANKKWFRNLAVSEIVAWKFQKMNPQLPRPPFDPKKIKVI